MHRLSLTFDNGPTPGVTEHVLEVLAERGIKTTFFCVGSDLLLPGRRVLAQQAAAQGHWHGNHTLTHSIQFGNSDDPDLPVKEIGQAQEILGDLAHPQRFFRPWGDGQLSNKILSAQAIDYLVAHRYTLALWTCVPGDWKDPIGWVDVALAEIERTEWTSMVLHDQATGAMAQLAGFLDEVLARGVEIVQELPPQATPILEGRVAGDLTPLFIPPA